MTTTATLTTAISFDCADAAALAEFWATVAGGTIAADPTAEFAAVERPGSVDLNFNQVTEPKAAKNRVHIDISVDDLPAAASAAVNNGGNVVAEHDGWTVLQDPEGNEFCLVAA